MLIHAVLRGGGGERIVRIRNLSSRGLMIESNEAPDVGLIVEVAIGPMAIVGRVVWRKGKQFGIHSRNTISKDCLFNGTCRAQEKCSVSLRERLSDALRRERDYQLISRALQFTATVAFALAGSAFIAAILYQALMAPMQVLSAHLTP